MLATQDKYIDEAALKVHHLVQDQLIRDQLWAREDYIRRQNDRDDYYQDKIDILEKTNLEKDAIIADKDIAIADLTAEIETLKAQIASKNAEKYFL